MTTHDTLRWGDTAALTFATTDTFTSQAKQLAQLHWRWPLTWTALFLMVPQLNASETAIFTVAWEVTVGSGSTAMTYPIFFSFAPTEGVYTAQNDQRFLPGQDVQISASVSGTPKVGSTQSFQLGFFGAPMTEPHAPTEALEALRGTPEKVPEWMREGFPDEPLQYGPRWRR